MSNGFVIQKNIHGFRIANLKERQVVLIVNTLAEWLDDILLRRIVV